QRSKETPAPEFGASARGAAVPLSGPQWAQHRTFQGCATLTLCSPTTTSRREGAGEPKSAIQRLGLSNAPFLSARDAEGLAVFATAGGGECKIVEWRPAADEHRALLLRRGSMMPRPGARRSR